MRDTSKLDAAILANRANPTEASAAAVHAAMREQTDEFFREQATEFISRTRG